MTDIQIKCELEGPWTYLSLITKSGTTRVGGFGDCTDALGDLVRGALAIVAGAWRTQVQFDGEPFEWRLLLQRSWKHLPAVDVLEVTVLTFNDIHADLPNSEGKQAFAVNCKVDDFARAVADVAEGIWKQYGPEGYARDWNRVEAFPVRALTALKAALSVPEPPRPTFTAEGPVTQFVIAPGPVDG